MNRSQNQRLMAMLQTLALLHAVFVLSACGDSGQDAAKGTAPVKIKVELQAVHASATEDNLGGDEFYVIGGSRISKELTTPVGDPQATISEVIDVDSDNVWREFGDGRILYEGSAEGKDTLHIGAIAYDEDVTRDWGPRVAWVNALTQKLMSSPDPKVKAAGVVVFALTILVNLDSDDELGRLDWDIPVAGPATETRIWAFDREGPIASDYHYEVRILITRS